MVGLILLAAGGLVSPATAFAQVCAALPPPSGAVIDVTPAQAGSLAAIVQSARSGDTIRLADGYYPLSQTLVFRQPGVTLRSHSGNRAAVMLDGRYVVGEILLLYESNVTIADVTLARAYTHPVHVSPELRSTTGTLLHNLHIVDGAEQFIKINPNNGYYADAGIIRCSSLEMTGAGRLHVRNNCYTGGIDAHQARGWRVYDNIFSGFWCSTGLSEHAIHFWTGSRDTIVDRNVVWNSARGVGFGLGDNTPGRSYADQPCGGATGIGHYGGSITNVFIFANDPALFASSYRFDVGIGLEQSCETNVLHNTIVSTSPPAAASIDWRFTGTTAVIANNLVSHDLESRDGGRATLAGNITNAPSTVFVDGVGGDLHLRSTATAAIDRAVPLATPLGWDIDGHPRGALADVGADELVGGPGVTVTAPATALGGTSITAGWTAAAGQTTSADVIGLFTSAAGDAQPIDAKPTAGALTGTLLFIAPNVSGTYQFRYFTGNPPVRVAVSNTIAVTAVPPPPPADTQAPTVSITSPVNGASVRKTIAVSVAAADNVGVTKVELYVDGVRRAESSTAPFTMTWNSNHVRTGSHTLQAKAYDAAGNVGTSSPIVVVR